MAPITADISWLCSQIRFLAAFILPLKSHSRYQTCRSYRLRAGTDVPQSRSDLLAFPTDV